MSIEIIGLIGLVVLVLIFLLGMPIGISMALVGFLGIWYIRSQGAALTVLATEYWNVFSMYIMTCVPMFVLMGMFAVNSGITTDLYSFGRAALGHIRGGIAMGTTIACALFGACCGSTAAEVATMSKIALPEMKRYNYDLKLSSASIASSGSLAMLIPPSLGFIAYGMVTDESVGRLFIGGIIPGVLLSILFIMGIYIMCLRNPELGPPGPRISWKERLASIFKVVDMGILFVVVIGGIFFGIFTPTEAGGVGAMVALLICLAKRRMNWRIFLASIQETAILTGMFLVLIGGAFVFVRFMAYTGLATAMMDQINTLGIGRYGVIWLVFLITLVMGCFLDTGGMVVLLVPIFYPIVVTGLGFDSVWFGVFFIVSATIGLITPPVGVNVFILNAAMPEVPITTIFRGCIPFVALSLVLIIILIYFPQIAMFLPNMMFL